MAAFYYTKGEASGNVSQRSQAVEKNQIVVVVDLYIHRAMEDPKLCVRARVCVCGCVWLFVWLCVCVRGVGGFVIVLDFLLHKKEQIEKHMQ